MGTFNTLESCSSEIFRQSTELVEYYEIRKGSFHHSIPTSTKEITDVDEVLDYVLRVQKKLRLDLDPKKKLNVDFVTPSRKRRLRLYPQFILFPPQDLSKILMNVSSNALKYTQKGIVRVDVVEKHEKAATEEEEEEEEEEGEENRRVLLISVVDTGIGIKKDILDRIFQPFVRNETGKQSFSIGLMITKSIVERAGGTITIESEGENKGTKVTVCLPFRVPTEDEIEVFVNDRAFTLPMDENVSMGTRKDDCFEDLTDILVVEDNRINQKVLVKHIRMIVDRNRSSSTRVRIHTANDGVEALSLMPSLTNPPIIFTDVDMPRMDGIEFTRRVRERSEHGSRLIIYAITATLVGNVKEYCSKYGFDGVVSKPVYFQQMIGILRFMAEERKKKIDRYEEEAEIRRTMGEFSKWKNEKSTKRIKAIESEDRRIVMIDSGDSEKVKTIIFGSLNFVVTTFGVYLQPLSPIPSEYCSCWLLFAEVSTFLFCLLFVLFYFLRFSTELLSFLNLSILFFCLTVLSQELCFLKEVPSAIFVESAYIIRANQSLESFTNVMIVSLAFYFKIVVCELTRSEEYFLSYTNESFFFYTNKLGLAFLILDVVTMSRSFITMRKDRRKRWGKTIREMLAIEEDLNLTTSKVSHDLATPSSALSVYLDELNFFLRKSGILHSHSSVSSSDIDERKNMRKFESKIQDFYLVLRRCSFELEISIHNFLASCKIRNGMVVKKLAKNIHFASFIRTTVDRFRILLSNQQEKRGSGPINLVCQIDPKLYRSPSREKRTRRRRLSGRELDEPLCVDMFNILLVVKNVLFNAIVHSKTATRIDFTCRITNSTELGGQLEIAVKDDGVGIDQKFLDHFESMDVHKEKLRFKERFSNTLGLGLIVCKYLSAAMEQPTRFNVTSTPSKGTIARLQFPFRYYFHKDDTVEGEEEEEEGEGEEVEEVHFSLRKKELGDVRVLCVDDDVIIGNFLRMFLTRMGFSSDRVFVENHEEEAIRKLSMDRNENKYDILISDLNLVNIQFPEMIDRVPKECIPSVIICATGSPEDLYSERNRDILEKKEVRVNAVVSKPIDFDSLQNSLRSFVEV